MVKLPEPLDEVDRHFATPQQWARFLSLPNPETIVGIQITKEEKGGITADCMIHKEGHKATIIRYKSYNCEWVKQ